MDAEKKRKERENNKEERKEEKKLGMESYLEEEVVAQGIGVG